MSTRSSGTLPRHDACAPGDALDRAAMPPVLFEVLDGDSVRFGGRVFPCFLAAKTFLDRADPDAKFVRCTRCGAMMARRVPVASARFALESLLDP